MRVRQVVGVLRRMLRHGEIEWPAACVHWARRHLQRYYPNEDLRRTDNRPRLLLANGLGLVRTPLWDALERQAFPERGPSSGYEMDRVAATWSAEQRAETRQRATAGFVIDHAQIQEFVRRAELENGIPAGSLDGARIGSGQPQQRADGTWTIDLVYGVTAHPIDVDPSYE